MGLVFEELVRKFNEAANEEAGDHFTPREVIKLMVNILFDPDDDILTQKGIIRTLYDPTCGTGGMLTVSSEHLHHLNPDAQLILFGQDYNPEAYAICCADMLIKGESLDNIKFGDTLGRQRRDRDDIGEPGTLLAKRRGAEPREPDLWFQSASHSSRSIPPCRRMRTSRPRPISSV